MPADLHIHSSASDGTLSPTEIVLRAQLLGLTTIALTDHDTVNGIEEAVLAGKKHGIQVVSGIELSTDYKGAEVHVLGYFIKNDQGALLDRLEQLRQSRLARSCTMIRKLNHLGVKISWDQVKRHVRGNVVGRPHIARAMIDGGYVGSVAEAFSLYLGEDRPAYVPRLKLVPEEALGLIHDSKGAAVMAHPGLVRRQYVTELMMLDWQGIEVYHPEHDRATRTELEQMANQRRLIQTGGSDFHGGNREGRALGACVVADDIVARLEASRRF